MFHLDVVKVDLDVAYICKCFKCFHTYVVNILSGCLHMFAMVTHVFSSFFCRFASVSDYVANVSAIFDV